MTAEIERYTPLPAGEFVQRLARALLAAGCFPDTASAAQALAKLVAGIEYGIGPTVALREIHLIRAGSRLQMEPSAALQAALLRRSGRYDYRVTELTDEACEVAVLRLPGGEEIGRSRFTLEDARRAGLLRQDSGWSKFPRNMLWARAISNAVRWFAPDVLLTAPVAPVESAAPLAGTEPPEEPSTPPQLRSAEEGSEGGSGPTDEDGLARRRARAFALVRELGLTDAERRRICESITGAKSFRELDASGYDRLIAHLEEIRAAESEAR